MYFYSPTYLSLFSHPPVSPHPTHLLLTHADISKHTHLFPLTHLLQASPTYPLSFHLFTVHSPPPNVTHLSPPTQNYNQNHLCFPTYLPQSYSPIPIPPLPPIPTYPSTPRSPRLLLIHLPQLRLLLLTNITHLLHQP